LSSTTASAFGSAAARSNTTTCMSFSLTIDGMDSLLWTRLRGSSARLLDTQLCKNAKTASRSLSMKKCPPGNIVGRPTSKVVAELQVANALAGNIASLSPPKAVISKSKGARPTGGS